MSAPRVRFAPSPTGYLHVGGARTALFNYLYARKHAGRFLLRIEDTDRERSTEAMTRAIVDALAWLGLEADEGPFHQADGVARHRAAAERLRLAGAAYRCFCSPEELRARREAASERGEGFGYDGRCRRLAPEEAEARAERGESHALRFAVPPGATEWEDGVHGPMRFENDRLDDFVILRSDGTPVYNLAVVCDDLEMRVSLVMRGDDHLSNTPKQILLYRALGAEPPAFAHLPMILGTDGRRLSKRHGAMAVEAYRDQGILPEAMVNFLALLGWSPGDEREVMGMEELVEAFSLERVLKKSAVFDPEKLLWLSGQHLRRIPLERLVPLVAEELGSLVEEKLAGGGADRAPEGAGPDPERLRGILEVVRERGRTVGGIAAQAAPFLAREVVYEEEAVRRFWKDPSRSAAYLRTVRERLGRVEPFEPDALEREVRGLAEELGVGAGRLIHPLRVALLGLGVSPGIFEVLQLLGRERSLERIDRAVAHLEAMAEAEAGAGGG
ncbi:MAG: glutamate--tRNA ligase [Gemmatimonadota bacterium]